MTSQPNATEELKVFISSSESTCGECGESLGSKAWITLVEEKGALCLACADLDHLVFLPSGNMALTRRSKKNSTLSAVVLKWSRARKRYERQGLLVEEQALEKAEEQCLADSEVRERRRERETVRRDELDRQYVEQFAQRVREIFPACPRGREIAIAMHACQKYSGRVGRSASAKSLDEKAVRLAVVAHIRHLETEAEDPIDRASSQANFMVLAYGSSPMPAALNTNETPIPPTFMFCTAEDMGHLRGMMELYAGFVRAKVPVETHFFANGEHGVGFAEGDQVLGEWPNLMFNWMRAGGFLTSQPRVAVEGIVKVDGEPLPHGYVIFTPLDKNGGPPVTAYIFNTGPVLGQFTIRRNQGLVPGRYSIEVRQNATKWLSNSRNEVIIKMNQKLRAGDATDADRQEWNDYARKRDLSPNIEVQRVYRRQRPKDKTDLVVEIRPNTDNRLQIEVFSR